MTDENAVDPSVPTETQVAADQAAAEAAEWQPEPVQPGSMADVEAARSGVPAQATDAAPVEPSAAPAPDPGVTTRLDALETRLVALADEVAASLHVIVGELQDRLTALEAKLP